MSKSLIKLLDNSIIPASVMIASKFVGILLSIKILNIPWSIKDYTNSILTVTTFLRKEDISTVTSYSDLAMYFALASLLTFNIVKAVYLHNTHLRPNLILQLARRNLLSLITGSYEIYHSCTVWITFTWIANILILINVLTERTYIWIGLICTISTLVLTWVLAQDVYREIDNIRKHPGEYSWE